MINSNTGSENKIQFISYTTPIHKLVIKGISLKGSTVYVTYEQNDKAETFSGDDISIEEDVETTDDGVVIKTIISVKISQEKSSLFKEGSASVQVNWVINNKRFATTIKDIYIERNLLSEVL